MRTINIKIEPKKSILDDIICYESINLNKLDLLINSKLLHECTSFYNQNTYENEKAQLKAYKMNYNEGFIKVHYKKNAEYGRTLVIKSLGAHNIRRQMRHTLFNENYMDVDIINAHPNMISQIMKSNNIKTEYLDEYINNRDEIINKLIPFIKVEKKDKTKKDQIKNLFIAMMYGFNPEEFIKENEIKEVPEILINYNKEMKTIQKIFCKNNPDIEKFVIKKNEKNQKKNFSKEGAIMSYIAQEYEHQILTEIYNYCITNKYILNNNCILSNDGLMIQKELFKNSLLKELSTLIYDKLGFKLEFKNKEMNEGYSDELIYENIKDNEIIKINDDIKNINEKINENTDLNILCMYQKQITQKTKEREKLINKLLKQINNEFIKEKKEYEKEQKKREEKIYLNELRKQEECQYEEYKKEFEKKFFKIQNPINYGSYINNIFKFHDIKQLREYTIDKFKDLKTMNFIETWREDENKRQYDKIIFNPNLNEEMIGNNFNLFNGFNWKEKKEITSIKETQFYKLLNHLCKGDTIELNYILNWLGHIIQKPYKKTNVAIVLYSKVGGVGKNALIDGILKLLKGYTSKIESIDDITNKFNNHLVNKLLIYGDEICARASKLNDKLKSIITRTEQILEQKGQDALILNDYSNWIFTTNNEQAFKIEQGNRRMFMVECTDIRLDKEEYINYYNEINDDNKMELLFNYLLNLNLSYNIGVDVVPDTNYKKRLEYESKPAIIQYLFKNYDDLYHEKYKSKDLYDDAMKWAKDNYISTQSLSDYGIIIKKIIGKYKKINNGVRFYQFSKDELIESLKNYDIDYFNYLYDN